MILCTVIGRLSLLLHVHIPPAPSFGTKQLILPCMSCRSLSGSRTWIFFVISCTAALWSDGPFGRRQKTLKSVKNVAAILLLHWSTSASVSDSHAGQMRSPASTPASSICFWRPFKIHPQEARRRVQMFANVSLPPSGGLWRKTGRLGSSSTLFMTLSSPPLAQIYFGPILSLASRSHG